jgi:hypothetical protein
MSLQCSVAHVYVVTMFSSSCVSSQCSVAHVYAVTTFCEHLCTPSGPCLPRCADMLQFSTHVDFQGQRTLLFPAVKTIVLPVEPIVCVHVQRAGTRMEFVTIVMDCTQDDSKLCEAVGELLEQKTYINFIFFQIRQNFRVTTIMC